MILKHRRLEGPKSHLASQVRPTFEIAHITSATVVPQISVVMSVHKRVEPRILQTAIDSVQLQTVTDYEFKIVVDGTVTPEQKRILDYASQSDSRIALLHNVHSIGICFLKRIRCSLSTS